MTIIKTIQDEKTISFETKYKGVFNCYDRELDVQI